MILQVKPLRRDGVDVCEGQVLVRCCIDNTCADVPLNREVEAGSYNIEEAARHPELKICLDVLRRQSEIGIEKIRVCNSKRSERCRSKLVEYVLARYGGPVLLVGFNKEVANAVFSFTNGFIADVEGRLHPYEFVDVLNLLNWVKEVKSIVVAPGFLEYGEVIEFIKRAREMGKHVVVFGALSTIYKDLGVEYFCPYGSIKKII